ncbi:hypothetical protein GUJ93_ZPchr0013g34795 [Zizania palustris]|uniref:Uncharacterized protein n=1 Tax=Zizania palustris TaxID=103762 RepID=A0A8J5X3B6_ZIZPA|nr:hypothetical protein GUJ93_ZPchr0013g34795 [Zizania palustris]
MKLLQDLVLDATRWLARTLMFDEIINYVQSVEFLPMKLATMNPQLDFSSLQKDMYEACGPSLSFVFPLESVGAASVLIGVRR